MMNAHEIVLVLHSLTRWLVLAAACVAEALALHGHWTRRPFATRDRRALRALVAAIDLQACLGLSLLFLLSPLARLARSDLAAAWQQPPLRFFGLVHPSLAACAAIVAHGVWIAARRKRQNGNHRRNAIGVGLVLVLLACAIPWPGRGVPRPLFRLF